MTRLKAVGVLLAIAAVGLGAWFVRIVPFEEQWPMYEALRTTAAIIFAVVGAWMAIIYPDRLKLSFQPEASKRGGTAPTGWGQLFTPVVHSTAILSVILVIGVVAPIAKRYPSPIDQQYMDGASYGFLVALTLWQLWTVVLTLIPADKVKSYLDRDDRRASYIESMTARGIKQDEHSGE